MSVGPSEGKYVGRSSEVSPEPGEPEGPTIEKAIRAAYEKATADKPRGTGETFTFTVVKVVVEGTNPISDYRAHLDDGG